ncbi:MAG: pyridoxal-phosphate dependent enzyme [Actinobacteria bacterium]|nr:pyridoxal-phosphate dependent enzyme [Actinomycetota bacterium]
MEERKRVRSDPVNDTPTIADIEAARERLAGVARETPLYSTETFSRLSGRTVLLKAENLQRTGSFKIRGAYNTIATLSAEERNAGVVAASAGNHGQAVAWAAREAGTSATIFMPEDAPMAKVEATRAYGGVVEPASGGFEEAVAAAHEHVERTGATLVHAFEDARVIAGQGTIGLELVEQAPEAATVLIPVGGGGLASGISIALRERRPGQRIVGVICRPGLTIADGIAVKSRGDLAGAILDRTLDDIVEVSDEEISDALVLCLERKKLLVEGAGAVGLAALLAGRAGGEDPVAIVLSGGNVDATTLISVMRLGLTRSSRYLAIRTLIPDRPGELRNVLDLVAQERGNLVSVDHHREGTTRTALQTEVELVISTRDEEHCGAILTSLANAGYAVERLGPPATR